MLILGIRFNRIALFIVVVFLFRALSWIPLVLDDDEAWFAASASLIQSPSDYLQTVIDNKPPGTTWFYWAVNQITRPFFDSSSLPRLARAFNSLLLWVTAYWVGTIARFYVQLKVNLKVALLFLMICNLGNPKLFSVSNETLMLPCICAAIGLVWRSKKLWRFGFAGVLIGFATLIKQTGFFFLLPLLLGAKRPKQILTLFICFIASLSLGIFSIGPLKLWYWSVEYPEKVLSVIRGQLFSQLNEGLTNCFYFILAVYPLFPFSLLKREYSQTRRYLASLFKDPETRILGGWMIASLLAVGLGKGIFFHYFILLIPPLIILGSPSLLSGPNSFEFKLSDWRMKWMSFFYVSSSLISGVPESGLFWGNDLHYYSRVTENIRLLTDPQQSVLIWGGNPIPAALSERPLMQGFVTSRFAAPPYSTPESEILFETQFKINPPALVVDLHLRGDNRFNYPLITLKWFGELLEKDYVALSDPSLPWAQFLLRKDLVDTIKFREIFDHRLCISKSQIHLRTIDLYPRSLATLNPILDSIRHFDLLAVKTLAQDESHLRREFASEIFDSTFCMNSSSVREQYRPFAFEDARWWMSLAIVELQPVALPRKQTTLQF